MLGVIIYQSTPLFCAKKQILLSLVLLGLARLGLASVCMC